MFFCTILINNLPNLTKILSNFQTNHLSIGVLMLVQKLSGWDGFVDRLCMRKHQRCCTVGLTHRIKHTQSSFLLGLSMVSETVFYSYRLVSKDLKTCLVLRLDNSMDRPGHLWAPRHYEGLTGHPEQDVEAQGCFLEDPGGSGGFPGRLGFLLASQAPTRGSRYLPAAVSPEQVAPKQHLQSKSSKISEI